MLAVSALSGGTIMNAIAIITYANDVNERDSDGKAALWVATTEGRITFSARCFARRQRISQPEKGLAD
jgi:hypothetical protein